MPRDVQQSHQTQGGFSLIELLVVISIIGVLAAMAIPTFLDQRAKAYDASAKVLARTAQTTMEVIGADHNGSYSSVAGPGDLGAVEGTISTTPTAAAYLDSAFGAGNTWTVETTSIATGNRYRISRDADSSVTRTCTVGSLGETGGCHVSGGSW